jgi:hypothetical protein
LAKWFSSYFGEDMYIPNITNTHKYDDTTQSKENETNTKSYFMKPSFEQINSEKWVTDISLYYTSQVINFIIYGSFKNN